MTYGWAILIIAVVLAALFQLGIFNAATFSAQACISQPGYSCSAPLLNTTGNLSVGFGEIGSQITLTGLGCSANSSIPSTFIPVNDILLFSGQQVESTFQCPLTSNTVGTPFSGSLYIRYDSGPYSGLISKVATVTAKVSAYGAVSTATTSTSTSTSSTSTSTSSTTIPYVPIVLTNSQTSATPAPFQQMIGVPSTQYSSYINTAWSNVEFTTGAGGTGTALQAWVENNATNTATNTLVWVSLPSGIAASSSVTIYMDFMPGSVMSSSGPTGEAPQLSSTYAEYDDGANIFQIYQNFAGTSLPSGWSFSQGGFGGGSYTVSNGLTLSTGTAPPLSSPTVYNTILIDAYNYILESYASTTTSTYNTGFIGAGSGVYTGTSCGTWEPNNGYVLAQNTNTNVYIVNSPGSSGCAAIGSNVGSISVGPYYVFSLYWSSQGTQLGSINYGTFVLNSNSIYLGNSVNIEVFNGDNAGINTVAHFTWVRARAVPPNGVMPSVSFGSVQ